MIILKAVPMCRSRMYLRFKKLTFDVKLVLKLANEDRVEAGCSCGQERSEIQFEVKVGRIQCFVRKVTQRNEDCSVLVCVEFETRTRSL